MHKIHKVQLFIAGILLLSSCAHLIKTPHEVCTDPSNVARYKNYEQCYSEVLAARQGFSSGGSSYTEAGSQPVVEKKNVYTPIRIGGNRTRCRSVADGLGGVITDCN